MLDGFRRLDGFDRTVLTRYYRDLLNFCMRKVRDRDTAADLAQESYARVLSMQQSGQVILEPGALLRQVALRAKIDLDRRAEVRQHDDIDALEEARQPASPRHLQPEEAYASAQAVRAYLDTIDALPPRCREAFCMYLFDGLPNKEIAERMGVSLSMVNQYISRGKLACAARREALDHGG
ncbi:RNA polymerase sigma factor [Verticiella sediminum]|uniref:RNA polymerase sigma factor n=1 Tax=Verticiella sediminum TaxID=1247510 RepID=A0A556ATY7_9BURK|nr:RNA polymerase sigma factor [Verticiella sediminum]TSH96397.1 RNA polymerase sigma factor [Verticiella sediminum]